jgi:uncharacterized protein YjbI with pentapeptide repeats
MANQEHLDILAKGVGAWNAWRKRNGNISPELSKAELRGAKLENAHLGSTVCFDGNTRRTDLSGAKLNDAWLHQANLSEADLSRRT